MIVDPSVILAIAIINAPERHMSAVNWLETMMVVESRAGTDAADDTILMMGQL